MRQVALLQGVLLEQLFQLSLTLQCLPKHIEHLEVSQLQSSHQIVESIRINIVEWDFVNQYREEVFALHFHREGYEGETLFPNL